MTDRVIMIALGGASCSGKTTLAKFLKQILPPERTFILHQDDLTPPAERLPIHPIYGVQDWDSPETALEWSRFNKVLSYIRQHAALPPPPLYSSHDHMNKQNDLPLPDGLIEHWRQVFAELDERQTSFCIVDGFLMYWDRQANAQYDIKLFVREDEAILRKRREERNGYNTAEGEMWQDPPGYWQNIVWPAYLKAHRHLFRAGDVEHGRAIKSDSTVNGHAAPNADLLVLEASQYSMADIVRRSCEEIRDYLIQAS
ncbi:uncharacterized protein L969DRAFT_14624 [Mixia osmundae IAM 14324]|uniref:Phosphoribulokinase/uridine kinase domain-containing protein n=1 Tax=Mixia osmundae (strain CBS 9802 / IAM 14324 / JCM 22182 / KY 12970) TaxID=764103 RepID=G7E2U3_MIXOS|nr:uncharacterized protein L969DRAFT_14624 [Mixia osmundae IAM 14324]KEI42423.1 hypothetical protein L969DRAFT_14624 [Mixia osmundae IAM 14324]GAA97287.1 hypothetical protein E5Q_03965 [Mixia osmundae IAM 14324]